MDDNHVYEAIARYLSNELSVSEKKEFEEWLKKENNQSLFETVQSDWGMSAKESIRVSINAKEDWNLLKARIDSEPI